MANKDNTIWLHNTNERVVGIADVTVLPKTRLGFLSVNANPLTFSVDLTPSQMRELSAKLLSAAEQLESSESQAAA